MDSGDMRHRLMAILAADAVGYSRLMSMDDRATVSAIESARGVFRTHVGNRGGRVIDTAGDSVLAVFDSAVGAVATAIAVQQELFVVAADVPEDRRMQFRIGVHMSDLIEKADGTVYGDGVNIAARLQGLAEPNGILVSESIRSAVRGKVEATFEDCGNQVAKNIGEPIHVWRLDFTTTEHDERTAISPTDVDARALHDGKRVPRTAPALNLPMTGEPLLGRDQDTSAVIESLTQSRLVTVVGPGGVGKTSLAQVVARQVLSRFSDGVRWVDLSVLDDPEPIVTAIAAAACTHASDSGDGAKLARALATQCMLIVLDNCEHVATSLAPVVQTLLAGAPSVRLLATSQQLLQVRGERAYRLDALAVPEFGTSLGQARHYSAVALLEQRAQSRDQRFALSGETIAHAIDLCRRLDGLALAIEMAAVRLPALGFRAVLAGLESLRSSTIVGPVRHRTLRAALEWSHDLLGASERAALRRLSVFSGTFELAAALTVGASDDIDAACMTETLASLVDKSLVQVSLDEPPRYRLLLSMKEFAGQQLATSGELDSTLRRHAMAMANIARYAERSSWLALDQRDYSDLLAAFDRAVSNHDAGMAGVIGEALEVMEGRWALSGSHLRRSSAAVSLLDFADPPARARLWNCIDPGALRHGPRGMSRLEVARARLSAWQQLGEQEQVYLALGLLAIEQARAGDKDAAENSLVSMRTIAEPTWSPRRRWEEPWRRAHVREYQGDAEACVEARHEGLAIAEAAGDESLTEVSRIGLAEGYLLLNEGQAALALLAPLVDRLRSENDRSRLAWVLDLLCTAFLLSEEFDRARSAARELVTLHYQQDTAGRAAIVSALLAATVNEHSTGARLLGHANGWFDSRESSPEPIFRYIASRAEEKIEHAIGMDALDRLKSEGITLSQAAVDSMLGDLFGPPFDL